MSAKEKTSKRISNRRFLLFTAGMVSLLAIFSFSLKKAKAYEGKVVPSVTVEAGSEIRPEFFTSDPSNVLPAIPLSMIDKDTPATYDLVFWCDNIRYESTLNIVDTIPPEGSVQDLVTDIEILPDVNDFVTSSGDVTAVSVSFEQVPDIHSGGIKDGSVKLTDTSGNTTILPVRLTVIDDFDAPVVYGIHAIHAYIGDNILYREGLTIEDDKDEKPMLEIDTSSVKTDTPGSYKITYRAYDHTGNERFYDNTVTLEEKPEGYMEPDEVYELAQNVLDRITTDDMTVEQKGFCVYFWCKDNINYVGHSDKSHWTKGAYEGFTKLGGDCFTYAACCKAFFDIMGVDNYIIERVDPVNSTHFWNYVNLQGGWYFIDCSRSNSPLSGYLLTESELDALNRTHGPRYHYDHTGLPNAATESIQSHINYNTRKVDFES